MKLLNTDIDFLLLNKVSEQVQFTQIMNGCLPVKVIFNGFWNICENINNVEKVFKHKFCADLF